MQLCNFFNLVFFIIFLSLLKVGRLKIMRDKKATGISFLDSKIKNFRCKTCDMKKIHKN